MTMLPRAGGLRRGDTVFSLANWRKQGIVAIKLDIIEGNIAKIAGQYLALDREFFKTREEALKELTKRVFAARRILEQHCKAKNAELDRLMDLETLRSKQEPQLG